MTPTAHASYSRTRHKSPQMWPSRRSSRFITLAITNLTLQCYTLSSSILATFDGQAVVGIGYSLHVRSRKYISMSAERGELPYARVVRTRAHVKWPW